MKKNNVYIEKFIKKNNVHIKGVPSENGEILP